MFKPRHTCLALILKKLTHFKILFSWLQNSLHCLLILISLIVASFKQIWNDDCIEYYNIVQNSLVLVNSFPHYIACIKESCYYKVSLTSGVITVTINASFTVSNQGS